MTAGQVTVDEYITSLSEETQTVLTDVRAILREVVPEAEEKLSYGMPTLTLDGRYLVYFAGWKSHVSLYPLPEGDPDFEAGHRPLPVGEGDCPVPVEGPYPRRSDQAAGVAPRRWAAKGGLGPGLGRW